MHRQHHQHDERPKYHALEGPWREFTRPAFGAATVASSLPLELLLVDLIHRGLQSVCVDLQRLFIQPGEAFPLVSSVKKTTLPIRYFDFSSGGSDFKMNFLTHQHLSRSTNQHTQVPWA